MTEKVSLNKNILLVEDDRSHREFVTQILENMGCKVFLASSGEECMEFLKVQGAVDIILLDLILPGMSGFDVAKLIQAMKINDSLPDIPMLAISSTQDNETIEACLDAGMKGHIPKSLWKPKWEPNIKEKLESFIK